MRGNPTATNWFVCSCDVADTPENGQFFQEYKEQLKARFRQIDIWMTTYPIEVI